MKNILFLNEKSRISIFEDSFFSKGELASNYNDDLDQRIHNYLLDLHSEEINSFTLPISLNEKFFDFSGLMFAHHLRLTRQIKSCDTTIIFYGILEIEQLLRLTDWATVLLTSNVIYVNIEKYSFEDIKKSILGYSAKKIILKTFIEKLKIHPPANYDDGHHSIDNEFALIQWSKHIKCYDNLPLSFKTEFDSRLFLKYLRVKHSLIKITNLNQLTLTNVENSSVLLVDDESKKGWGNFYHSIFNGSKITFEDSGIDFKNEEKENIIQKVELKIKEFKPDVVLLDLRLHDSDFGENVIPENLTGIEILDSIKEINPGIQVIVTTASNKAWNFNLAKQKGCFDFIIKSGYENPDKSIHKLQSSLKIATKRSLFLKKVGSKISELKILISTNDNFEDMNNDIKTSNKTDDRIRKKLFSNIEVAFDMLDLSSEIAGKQKYFAYSYLQLFICIEEFLSIKHIFEFGDKCYVKNTILVAIKDSNANQWTSSIKFIDEKNKDSYYILKEDKNNTGLRPSQTDFKMSAILIYLFNQDDSKSKNWPKIRDTRNKKAAHPEKGNVTENDISNLLDFLLYIFNKEHITHNDKKGLPDEIKESDLLNLRKLNTK